MEQRPPRADLVSGLCWIALGAAIVYGSWAMDRLENLKINPLTAPGLVPGILGAAIALCGLVMTLRAARAGALRTWVADPAAEPIITWRIALSVALCLGFALGLVGRGLPFWLAAGTFLFVHIFVFEYGALRSRRQLARGALVALAVGAGASFVITMIFQEFFLVRLP
jgi:hypothetical protein